MKTFTLLAVEFERDGDWDNWEILDIEAESWEAAARSVKKPKSFQNPRWGVRKVWDAGSSEAKPLYSGMILRR